MRLLTSILAGLAFLLGAAAASAEPLRVALVLPGPITDGTFNSAAYSGIEAAKKKYDIDVSVRENT